MSQIPNSNSLYDLEERTSVFARDCRGFIRNLPKTISNIEDARQLVRSSGSVAANYIEANESLSKKDFIMRIKISRKEVKETILWLKLVSVKDDESSKRLKLIREATELMKIFGSIVVKCGNKS